MGKAFDFIIVGAGSAGCVLAARLSADPRIRVLLLEAGPRDWNPVFRVPIMAGRLYGGRYCNWGYETEPEPDLGGRRIPWPRGRVIGGTSSINGMIYIRGNRQDYDGWAQMGLRSWSYDRVLPYFRRSERSYRGETEFHGAGGELRVGPPTSANPLFEAFIQAGMQAGHRLNPDFNGADQEGVGRYDYNIWNGQRWSAARCFLDPVRRRPNLTVLTGARLDRVLLEKGRAVGASVRIGGRTVEFRAEREVVLSGGTVNSPMALMHSGIGDADRLGAVGIEPAVDLKGVGRNLQDHLQVVVAQGSKVPDETWDRLRLDRAALGFVQAAVAGKGPFSRFPHESGAFLKTDPSAAAPEVQVHFVAGGASGALRHPFSRARPRFGGGYVFYGSICQLRPESVGELTLRSSDPRDAPVIRANYLSSPTDQRVLRDGIRLIREVFAQPALASLSSGERSPGPEVRSDAEIDAFVAKSATTVFHPVGTCRMGVDEAAVVDEQLRVRGVEGLRVIDASVMPKIPSGNTHAPTVMIAERGAELLLEG